MRGLIRLALLVLLTAVANARQSPPAAFAQKVALNIASQPVADALRELGQQTGIGIAVYSAVGRGLTAPRLEGEYTPAEALERILAPTGLHAEYLDDKTVAVLSQADLGHSSSDSAQVSHLAEGGAGTSAAAVTSEKRDPVSESPGPKEEISRKSADEESGAEEVQTKGIPEVLVKGSRTLDLDIVRSRDDAQPYIVFDRETIEKSGALDIEDFLKNRLTAAPGYQSDAQNPVQGGNASFVDLRGLRFAESGAPQTVILVDGHRLAPNSGGAGGTFTQPDMNGIPLGAIERIEVLPATASGIYGGGATGGVINIVLRRKYTGLDTTLTYDNSFDGGGASRRMDLAGGFNLGGTDVMLAGSYSHTTPLLWGDRDFLQSGRARRLANNPSAFFGDPFSIPVGATTNIAGVDSNFNLTNLTLKNGTPLNSPFTFVPYGYQGPASDNGAALVADAGHYNFAPPRTSQVTAGALQSLLNGSTVKSVSATLRREFTPRVSAFLDLSGSDNSASSTLDLNFGRFTVPASAASNPFNEDIIVTTPTFGVDQRSATANRNYRAVAGLVVDLSHGWRAEADYTWNRYRNDQTPGDGRISIAAANTAVSSGVTATGAPFNIFRDTNAFPVDFSPYFTANSVRSPIRSALDDIELRFAGPLGWSLPAGSPTLSMLLEHRKESLGDVTTVSPFYTSASYGGWQSIDSLYLEALIPLVSARNRVPAVNLLEFQIAGRRDQYSVTGANVAFAAPGMPLDPPTRFTDKLSSTDPTLSLRYQPLTDVTIRGSYSTGFLPPDVGDLVPGIPEQVDGAAFGLTDPRRGNEPVGTFNNPNGGNPNLRPEKSKSWAAGIILTPRFVSGLRASADWIKIEKRDNIISLDLTQENINNELLLPGFITRGPPSGGFAVGPITAIDTGLLNIDHAAVQMVDLALDYRLETGGWGVFSLSGNATRNLHFVEQLTSASPQIEYLKSIATLPWKAYMGLEWEKRQWTVGWTVRFFDSYCILQACASNDPSVVSQGSPSIPSQTYHDLLVRYRFVSSPPGALLANTELRFGVKNIFNKTPPIDVTPEASASYSTLGDPRLASYYLSLRKSF